jgi:hypothetical protein
MGVVLGSTIRPAWAVKGLAISRSRKGHVRNFVPQRGYSTQPRVSTLGILHQERRALKGRQIERPSKAESDFDGTSQLRTLTFARPQVRASSGTPISRPFRASRFLGDFPGLKPWAEFCSPCGAGRRSIHKELTKKHMPFTNQIIP